jgi:DeoR/GlpR family transcriptional regulator of sugar metabolism
LRELAAAGLCQRVYGGALPISPALGSHASRSRIAQESKRRIGFRAAELIVPGTTVILDAGTTALAVVGALRPDLSARVITHSATTAVALADHPGVDVFMLGGRLHKRSVSALGAVAAEAARAVSADLALLVLAGVHPEAGLTAGEAEEAALRRILIGRSADTYVLASIEKLGTVCPYKVTGLSEVAGIITDAPPGHPALRRFRERGVHVIEA